MAAKKESQFSPSSVAIPPHRFRCRDAFSTLCRLWSQSGLSFSLIFSLLLWPNNRPQISLIGFWKTRNHFYFHLTGSSRQLRLLHILFPLLQSQFYFQLTGAAWLLRAGFKVGVTSESPSYEFGGSRRLRSGRNRRRW